MSDRYDDFVATLRRSVDTSEDWATDETIVPKLSKDSTFDATRTLPSVSVGTNQYEHDFRIVGMLGEGGMGIVELAEQTALGRLVAMKSAHVDKGTSKRRLLEEAQVLGHLEHPNVVPVYVLGERKEDGSPVIVMRRIEGVEWSVKLKSELDIDYHLRVLLQVCNALRFSHDRGIIHRDLKPENVMIGDYGEVYLLDWGIALSLEGEHGLPSPHTTDGLAGTPAYMAPEMAEPRNKELDRRTDVYLLGAVLHELLDGSPPHKGNNFFSVCFAAFQSETKQYSDDINPELGDIARRAMQKNRDDRYQSVGEFASAIEDALEHEASFVLSDAAKKRFTDFENDSEGIDVVRFLTEAEYGYRQALEIWDGNITAQKGVQLCIRERIERALDAGDVASARGAYRELEDDPDLAERIDARAIEVKEQAARVGYLEVLEAEQDLRQGTRSRQRLVLLLMVGFVGISTFAAHQIRVNNLESTALETWNTYPRLAAVFFIGLLIFRKRLFGNVANRRISIISVALFILIAVMRFIHMQAESSMLIGLVSEQVLITMSAVATGVVARSLSISIAGLAYVIIGIIGLLIGSNWIFIQLLSVAHIVFFGTMAWVWRPGNTRQ